MEKREVAVREERDSGVFTPDPQVVEQALQRIRQYQAVVKEELKKMEKLFCLNLELKNC